MFLASVEKGEQKLLVRESLYFLFPLPSIFQLPVTIIVVIIVQVV